MARCKTDRLVVMVTVVLMETVACYSTCHRFRRFSCELISPRCVTSDIVCTSGDYFRCVNRRSNKTLICCKCDRIKEYNCTVADTNTFLMESDCVNDISQNENINEHSYKDHGNNDDHDIKSQRHPNSNVDEKGDNKYNSHSENDSHRITHTEGPNETVREHTNRNEKETKDKYRNEKGPSSSLTSSSSSSSVAFMDVSCLILTVLVVLKLTP